MVEPQQVSSTNIARRIRWYQLSVRGLVVAVLCSMRLVLEVVWGLQEHGLSAATLGGVAKAQFLFILGAAVAYSALRWFGRPAGPVQFDQHNAVDVEMMGLYWHFVDIVWIVIFTAVYLLEYL